MAPFAHIVTDVYLPASPIPVEQARAPSQVTEVVVEGKIDEDWLIGFVPNGGYLLGLVLQACNLVQADTNLVHPIYISSQFLGSSTAGACSIIVRRIKPGKNFTNLTAELCQQGRTNIQCQLIYGKLAISKHPFGPFPAAPNYMTPAHPSSLSRRCPLFTHPSKCTTDPFIFPLKFARHIAQATDPYYRALMEDAAEDKVVIQRDDDLGGGEFKWATWLEMTNPEDHITAPMLPVLTDLNTGILPRKFARMREPMWFPTLTLSLDFKHQIPPPNSVPGIASHTVGVFMTTRSLIEGRKEVAVEVWTAPSGIGKGEVVEGWQDRMFCLAVATQSLMTVPAALNYAKRSQKDVKL
ncbi:hypothetical protein CPB86DRAFT_834002 [Serendipita vermifera]|nr:hypothetical protein CPB86DRAFT_834002 [Serendipita vermifera]